MGVLVRVIFFVLIISLAVLFLGGFFGNSSDPLGNSSVFFDNLSGLFGNSSGLFDNFSSLFRTDSFFALNSYFGGNIADENVHVFDQNFSTTDLNAQKYVVVCSVGEAKCLGTNRIVCKNNSWVNRGDINGFCGYHSECNLGQIRCDGNMYFTCDINHFWVNRGRVNKKCGYSIECISKEDTCLDLNYLICKDNHWVNTGKIIGKCGYSGVGGDSVMTVSPVSNGTVYFTRENYGVQQDCITQNVCIARGNIKGLYNSIREGEYSSNTPSDTEWYFGGDCVNGLTFKTWINAVNNNPQGSINVSACLHLISDNMYFNIKFTSFTGSNGGGGFSYVRTRTYLQGTSSGSNTFVCNSGEVNCSGTNHLVCENNSWVNRGDINGFCGVYYACDLNQTSCLDSNYLVCDSNHAWVNLGGTNGFCGYFPKCFAGQSDCNDNSYLTCDNNYGWTNNGLVVGNCGVECLNDTNSCSDSNYLTCGANNKWVNLGDMNGKCGVNWGVVYFSKADFGNQKDCITSSVCLTRGNSQGLFNSVLESAYSSLAPTDTNWFFGSYCARGLIFSSWVSAVNNNPSSRVGVPACLHLISDDEYYNIIFNQWSGGNTGGGFSYDRVRTSSYDWN
ncbi:MAG: hypothetical protein NTY48_07020 [Candidatus Diapherotrites archaeon]|nr:hypothetical protein [Candidatus Diapherotrites archaeon]